MAVLRVNCPHCPAEHVAFDVQWATRHKGLHHVWACTALCGACSFPISFIATAKSSGNQHPPMGAITSEISEQWFVKEVWPIKTAAVAPPHTPPSVRKRYLEGEDAFRRGNWNSAVAMYRSALDIATKTMDGVPQNQTFYQRLQWLHDNHGITPDIHSWASHVRVEGNAALHDPEDFAENDAKALRFFTEMFLRYVFELPGAVREFRGEVGDAPQTA